MHWCRGSVTNERTLDVKGAEEGSGAIIQMVENNETDHIGGGNRCLYAPSEKVVSY